MVCSCCGARVAYIRVSTEEQRPDRQIDGLTAVCDELRVQQGVSRAAKSRPVFDALPEELLTGDTLVLLPLDRASRSSEAALLNRPGIPGDSIS